MRKKILLTSILLFTFLTNQVIASVLGTELIDSSSILMGPGANFYTNQFFSDQSGVNQQTEHYFDYTPNSNLVPVVSNGNAIFGKRTILEAAKYMKEQGLSPLMGINADFFSLQTGVPMSHTIIDGKIVTKDVTGQDAIGFNQDGTAFISWLEIQTLMQVGEQSIYIDNINKYRQPYTIYMFTDDFGASTQNKSSGLDIILGSVEGELKLGESVTAVVEEIMHYNGAIAIPEGKIVLSIDDAGFADLYAQMSAIQVGEKVTITNTVTGDAERWNNVQNGIGAIGGRILTNGKVASNLEKGAHPRTAIGIKPDGNVIFYTIDGRQNGYSYGVQLTTLANRLLELGCTDAINLDGGGSTSISGIYPGSDVMELLNSPSDSSLRKCANFIFLQNTKQATGELGYLQAYPHTGYYLSGATEQIEVKALDTAFYNTTLNQPVSYSVNEPSTITDNGILTFNGTGDVTVTTTVGNISNNVTLKSIQSPSSINIFNEDNMQELSEIRLNPEESVNLRASASYGRNALKSSDNCYVWGIEGNIGSVDENGLFKATSTPGVSGRLIISAGETTKYVNVYIQDIDDSLKYPQIYISFENGILSATVTTTGSTLAAEDICLKIDGEDILQELADEFASTAEDAIENNSTLNLDDISPQNSRVELSADASGKAIYINYKTDDGFDKSSHKITVSATNSIGYSNLQSKVVDGSVKAENPFTDTSTHWAADTISYMYSKGVINGELVNNKRLFRPQSAMTRAEFAVMICNALKVDTTLYEHIPLSFIDSSDIPIWAQNQIKAMYDFGIITGKSTDNGVVFDAYSSITRAEAMTIIGRILPEGMQTGYLNFVDNNAIPDWSKKNISILLNLGAVNGYSDGSILPNSLVSKAEAVKMLYYIY